jgi:hypothetical protein
MARDIRPAPALPLTGFIPRSAYVPPTVIVSDLLDLGAHVDMMLLELGCPAPPVAQPRPVFQAPASVRFDPLPRRAPRARRP